MSYGNYILICVGTIIIIYNFCLALAEPIESIPQQVGNLEQEDKQLRESIPQQVGNLEQEDKQLRESIPQQVGNLEQMTTDPKHSKLQPPEFKNIIFNEKKEFMRDSGGPRKLVKIELTAFSSQKEERLREEGNIIFN
jgi:hypothetical protein